MNSKTKILTGILVIVIILIGGSWIWSDTSSNQIPEKYKDSKYCERNDDCILISGGECCSPPNIAVNIHHRHLERVSTCSRACPLNTEI